MKADLCPVVPLPEALHENYSVHLHGVEASFPEMKGRRLHSGKTLAKVSESHLMDSLQLLWSTPHLITSADQI